jgi:hypothetical protein
VLKSVNHSFPGTFRVNQDKTPGERIYDLGNGQWNIPKLRELLFNPRRPGFDDDEQSMILLEIGGQGKA